MSGTEAIESDCGGCGVKYECSGCGEMLEGPPSEPPAFESPINPFDCDVCEFVHPEYQDTQT